MGAYFQRCLYMVCHQSKGLLYLDAGSTALDCRAGHAVVHLPTLHSHPLVYTLILIHCIILMVGGHYTYAEVPLFDNLFGMVRNNYDKLGHLAQGFVPAMVAREILIRKQVVQGRWWLVIFVISFCLGFSAFYELIEWWVALLLCTGAEAFLGTQGYEWDTQADMAFALLGAVMALVTLSRWHNKQLLSKP